LDELAATSGARAFYPQALEELDSITETIAAELRTQYILGYYPTRSERDGSWRKVAVHVRPDKTRGEINARTRAGYYAIKPGQAPKDAPKPSPRK
jgi:Ca-activated chloride channel family protein